MPLVTRTSNQGNLFKQALTPNWVDGDLWSDTTSDTVKVNVNGTATLIGYFKQATEPAGWANGDLWVDTDDGLVYVNVAGTATAIGKSSFSSAAVVTHSTTIGDYTTVSNVVYSSLETFPSTQVSITGENTITNSANAFDANFATFASMPSTNSGSQFNAIYDFGSLSMDEIRIKMGQASTGRSFYYLDLSEDNITWSNSVQSKVAPSTSSFTWDLTYTPVINYRYVRVRFGWYLQLGAIQYIYAVAKSADVAASAFDDNTATKAQTQAQVNPSVYADLSGAAINCLGVAIYLHANTTETEIQLRFDATTTFTSADAKRTITVSNLTAGAWNYIRFNLVKLRYLQIYGNSGDSRVLSISEIKYLTKTDSEILQDLGTLEISATSTSIGLDGT